MRPLLGMILALILAAVAQAWLGDGRLAAGWTLYLLAGGAFAWVATGPVAWPDLPRPRPWPRWGWGLALLGAGFVLVAAWSRFRYDQYGGWAFWLWSLGLLLFFAGVWWDGPSPDPQTEAQAARPFFPPVLRRRTLIILLGLILLVALFARFYALNLYPHGLQSDEANNGLDALKWLAGAAYTPYAETNEGQATLFTYLIALYLHLFGQSVTVMRMVPATVGVLTVLAFFALARELYDQRVALLTTALIAVDRWHITFSRIVYELILVPLVISLQMLFLIKALKTGRRRWWALAGGMLALGLNTYTAYRVVPFMVLAIFVYWLLAHRQRWREDLKGMGIFWTAAILAVAPLGMYVLRHGSIFLIRMRRISVFRDVEAMGSYEPIWSNLRKALLMFHVQGDAAALNNLPGAPMLHALVGILFFLGLIWALRWFWKERPAMALIWFAAFLSLVVLTVAHEAPNARRPIGLIPLIYLLVGAVFTQLWLAWKQAFGARRTRPLFALLLALVLWISGANLHTYFRVQAVDPAVWLAYSPEESAIGTYLAQQPSDLTIYIDPQYHGHAAIRFIAGPRALIALNPSEHIPLRNPPSGDVLFILEPKETQMAALLQQLYLTGVLEPHKDRYGRTLFLTFYLPAAAITEAQGLTATYWAGEDTTQPPVRQTKVPALAFDFTTPATQPLLPPFAARFEGALLVPSYGDYHLALTAEGGRAVLYLDDQAILSVEDGTQDRTLTLAAGFQGLRVMYQAGEKPGRLQLAWTPPGTTEQRPIPASAFYTLPGASNGLLGYYYRTPDWSGDPVLIRRDLFIAPTDTMPAPYSVMWVGKIAAPESGPYLFGTRSDDGSMVAIDGQWVVDNSGQHGAMYQEGGITLEQGWHDIKVLYNDLGGSRAMELWWRPPNGTKTLIASQYLRPIQGDLTQIPPLPPLPQPPTEPPPAPGPAAPPSGVQPPPETHPISGDMGDFPPQSLPVLWTFGTCGSGQDGLRHPSGVAVDEEGRVYVADTGNHRVVVLNADGTLAHTWGEAGEGADQFQEVFDLVITPDQKLAVLDAGKQAFSLWGLDGTFLQELGSDLALYHPRGLAVSPQGDFFIADTGGGRVVQTDSAGQFLASFAGPQEGGQPTDALLAQDGLLYVADPATGILWMLDPATGQSQARPGPRSNTVESPHLAALPDGRLAVTDPEAGRVLVFTSGLQPDVQWGGQGAEEGRFQRTLGVAANAERIVITDPDRCQVTALGLSREGSNP